jgi:CRP-like cAMP-binding protein
MHSELTSGRPRDTDAAPADEVGQRAAKNRLLSALSPDTRASLEPHLERITLEIGDALATAGKGWSFLYFPEDAAVSMIHRMHDGGAIEVGIIGNEGVVGLPGLLGAVSCDADAIAPIPGSALRAPVDAVRAASRRHPELLDVVHRYTHAYLAQVTQNAACNQMHSLEQRVARWLLTAHDRAGRAETLPLKHEYLAMMLGVHRPAVSLVVGTFKARGFVNYSRGRMHLDDRVGLESTACECYRIVRQRFEQILT